MPDTRYQGKSEPLPQEFWSDSEDDYKNDRDSDPDFHLNYSSSEESGWSSDSTESLSEEESSKCTVSSEEEPC